MTRRLAAAISLALCGAALEPGVRAPDDDGFPLSSYPMFAAPRSSELAMARARCVRRDGSGCPLAPHHLGTGEVMQAFATLQRAVAEGPEARAALCAAIAERVARDADRALGDAAAVEIVVGTYDAVAAMSDAGPGPSEREAVLVRCAVARGEP